MAFFEDVKHFLVVASLFLGVFKDTELFFTNFATWVFLKKA